MDGKERARLSEQERRKAFPIREAVRRAVCRFSMFHGFLIGLSCIALVSICAMIEPLFASASAIRLPSLGFFRKRIDNRSDF